MAKCPNCNTDQSDSAKFCPECGGVLKPEGTSNLGKGVDRTISDQPTVEGRANPVPRPDVSLGDMPTVSRLAEDDSLAQERPDICQRTIAGRFGLLDKIGQGGMGTVWKAEDNQFTPPRIVALKRLLAHDSESRRGVERFLQEASVVAQLNHLNIVTIFDIGQDSDGYFIVMEYVEGTSLTELIQAKGQLSVEETVDLAQGICHALSYAHKKRVIHRDIKPANILVTTEGIPKVLDFGLARIGSGSDVSMTGYGMGTLDYASPEQKRDAKSVDHRADIYSLGATIYQMLTGSSPKTIRSDRLPTGIDQVVLKCLEERVEDRYFSMDEVLVDLKNVALGKSSQRAKKVVVEDEPEGTCAACGFLNTVDARFCKQCGAGLFEACLRCKAELRAGSEYCVKCGVNVQKAKKVDQHLANAKSRLEKHQYGRAIKELDVLLELESENKEAQLLLERGNREKRRSKSSS